MLPTGILLTSLERGGRYLVPRGDTVIAPKDKIWALARPSNLESMKGLFGKARAPFDLSEPSRPVGLSVKPPGKLHVKRDPDCHVQWERQGQRKGRIEAGSGIRNRASNRRRSRDIRTAARESREKNRIARRHAGKSRQHQGDHAIQKRKDASNHEGRHLRLEGGTQVLLRRDSQIEQEKHEEAFERTLDNGLHRSPRRTVHQESHDQTTDQQYDGLRGQYMIFRSA
ncbi:MAG: hypothetical protein HC902_01480 [Calothrix sp. SM1_5_4]|nr:hypothetical protein [Calothrix sp. SM1_5_4]